MSNEDVEPAEKITIHCADAVGLVTEFLEDALAQRDLAAFEEHLNGCEDCTVHVDQMRMTVRLTSAANGDSAVVMPANFDELVALLQDRVEDD